jgi:hypothetical protein
MAKRLVLYVAVAVLAFALAPLGLPWWLEAMSVGAVGFAVLVWQSRELLSWRIGAAFLALGAAALGASMWISQSRGLALAQIPESTSLARLERRMPASAVLFLTFGALVLAGSVAAGAQQKGSQDPPSVV